MDRLSDFLISTAKTQESRAKIPDRFETKFKGIAFWFDYSLLESRSW